jgi:hypothetical protein
MDDSFKKIPDPTDATGRRSGRSDYDRIFEVADRGWCLGAGEGKVLTEKIKQLESEILEWRKV